MRRSVLYGLALALVFGAPAARAADTSAESFVAAIYDRYKGRDAKGTALDTPAQVRLVSFKNTGTPRTVILDLVRLREGWRIADITWDRNATLRGVLTGR